MSTRRATCLARGGLLTLVLLPLAGCDPKPRFDGAFYHDDRIAYRVGPIPASWRRIDVSNANAAFRDDAHEASILVNGRCFGRDDDVPLASLEQHLVIGTTDRQEAKPPETIPFDGREAIHAVLLAKLDGVQMEYDIYVLKKDGCVYDFVYVAPPERFGEGDAPFEQFVRGFHTLAGSGGR